MTADKAKKINLFSTFDGTTGGQAINAAIFSCEFKKRGHEVLNLCYTTHNINLELCGEIKSLKIPFIKKINNPYLNIVAKPIQFIVAVVNFWLIFRKQPRQKIICFGWGASLIALFSKILFRIKNIDIICRVGTHFKDEFSTEKFWLGRLRVKLTDVMIKILYKKAFVVSPISKNLKIFLQDVYQIPSEKIKVLYNPRDENKILSLSKEGVDEKNLFQDLPVIVTCGRMAIPKGQWHIIRAFSKVREKIPCRLLIIGQGDLDSYLLNLAKELNLEKDVYFVGWQKNPYKYFAKSDMFVFSSSWEGFANVLLEAMICGLPVISSDCQSGPREILAPDTDLAYQTDKTEHAKYGILLPVPDRKFYDSKPPFTKEEDVLADSVLEVLQNNALKAKYKEMSLQRAKDFGIERVMEVWIKLLDSV